MFFIDDRHEANFAELCSLNGSKGKDPEYRAVYYIMGVPDLYHRLQKKTGGPLSWTRVWSEDGETYEMSHAYNVLSHSERMLVELAQNLFNGEGNFNLMTAISVFGEDYKRITLDAVRIREGKL